MWIEPSEDFFLGQPGEGEAWSLRIRIHRVFFFSPAFLQVLFSCPGSKHKMIYQMHAKFAKRFRKTAGRKMDSKCIFNLLLGGSFSPEKEWQCEAHRNQCEDFQAFQWTLINALREQIAHLFRGHYVNNSGPWIWFMEAWLDQNWARKTRSFWVIRSIRRHRELRAALEIQGWPTAASQSWQQQIPCPNYSQGEERG